MQTMTAVAPPRRRTQDDIAAVCGSGLVRRLPPSATKTLELWRQRLTEEGRPLTIDALTEPFIRLQRERHQAWSRVAHTHRCNTFALVAAGVLVCQDQRVGCLTHRYYTVADDAEARLAAARKGTS
jgi:hypothetical protein